MIDSIEPAAPSIWHVAVTWVARVFVVGGGLLVGAILGFIVAVVTGITPFPC